MREYELVEVLTSDLPPAERAELLRLLAQAARQQAAEASPRLPESRAPRGSGQPSGFVPDEPAPA